VGVRFGWYNDTRPAKKRRPDSQLCVLPCCLRSLSRRRREIAKTKNREIASRRCV